MNVILLYPVILVNLILEDGQQRYFRHYKNGKIIYIVFNDMIYQQTPPPGLYIDRERELINQPSNEKKPQNGKLIRILLLTITMVDSEQFTLKGKLVLYTRSSIELYNSRNNKQVHRMHGMIQLENMYALIMQNFCNLGIYWIIDIFLFLYNTHIVSRN